MTNIMPNYQHRSTRALKLKLSILGILDDFNPHTILENPGNFTSNRLEFGFYDDLVAYRATLYGNCCPSVEYFDAQRNCWVLLVTFQEAL